MKIQEMTPLECFELLGQGGIARLGCAQSGQPYVVPIYFTANKDHVYSFSTLGKKVEWMRANPLVCLEADEIISPAQWRSVVVFGRYQELPDDLRWAAARNHAHNLLAQRASWWEPAYVSFTHQGRLHSAQPIFFRISIDEITGHRAKPDKHELAISSRPLESPRPKGWLARLIDRRNQTATPIDRAGSAATWISAQTAR